MEYINPNDVMYPDHATVPDWHLAIMVNPPVHPSTTPPMPGRFLLADQRTIERVPHPLPFNPLGNGLPLITFSLNRWPGVRVREILRGTVVIDGANDMVFAQHGWRTTVLNLKWPGYDFQSAEDNMRSRIDVRRVATRQALAVEICSLLCSFHQVASKHTISPEDKRWALTTGLEGIRPFDVVLLSAHYYRTVWVPEFYVIE